jgi:hypothetical protein
VSIDPDTTAVSTQRLPPNDPPVKAVYAASLAMKPATRGTPAIDAALISAVASTHHQRGPRAGSFRMSRVPVQRSRTPTTMNRAPLNSAWATRRAQPAVVAAGVPAPKSTTIRPSWLTVPDARSSLRSCWRRARRPPTNMVTIPTVRTSGRHTVMRAKSGARRAMR